MRPGRTAEGSSFLLRSPNRQERVVGGVLPPISRSHARAGGDARERRASPWPRARAGSSPRTCRLRVVPTRRCSKLCPIRAQTPRKDRAAPRLEPASFVEVTGPAPGELVAVSFAARVLLRKRVAVSIVQPALLRDCRPAAVLDPDVLSGRERTWWMSCGRATPPRAGRRAALSGARPRPRRTSLAGLAPVGV